MPASKIEVTSDPGGEAPLEVRLAWIGCKMPVHENSNDCGHIPVYAKEVISGKSVKSDGHDVPQADALWQLEKKGTHEALIAVAWWRAQGYPKKAQCFRFPSSSVRVLKTRAHAEGAKVTVLTDMETGSFNRRM